MVLAENIRFLRRKQGLSQDALAEKLGYKSYTTIQKWESGVSEPPLKKAHEIADFFQVDRDELTKRPLWEDTQENNSSAPIPPGFEPLPEMVRVPLIGSIACGSPILAEGNIDSYVGIPAAWRADFALTCHGDSMAPKICDGDIVCIRKQATVEPGEIAAVRIGEEATLKHFYQSGEVVQLVAENAAVCPPMVYQGEQLREICIEGKAVGFCRGLGK